MSVLKPVFIPLILLLATPTALTALIDLLSKGSPMDKEVFSLFWRLALFPIALATLCIRSGLSARRLQEIVMAISFIYLLASFADMFLGVSFDNRDWGGRAAGLVGNPNPFGLMMACSAIIALNHAFTAGEKQPPYYAILAFPLFIIGWLCSGSRAAGLALVAGVFIVLFFHRAKCCQLMKTRTGLLLTVSIILGAISALASFTEIVDFIDAKIGRSVSEDIRFDIWAYYLPEIKNALWLGRSATDIEPFSYGNTQYGPHNMYLEVLLKSGVLGLIAFLVCMLGILRRFYVSSGADKPVFFALFIMILLCGTFNSPLFGNEMTQGFFSLALALYLMARYSPPDKAF